MDNHLFEMSLSETEDSAYIVDNPSDRDYLDCIRILSVEIGASRRYIFSLEAPSSHLEEHGMYAVFEESMVNQAMQWSESGVPIFGLSGFSTNSKSFATAW